MASVVHRLVLSVTGDAWRSNNTAARAVAQALFTADDVVTEALIRGSGRAALTTTTA